ENPERIPRSIRNGSHISDAGAESGRTGSANREQRICWDVLVGYRGLSNGLLFLVLWSLWRYAANSENTAAPRRSKLWRCAPAGATRAGLSRRRHRFRGLPRRVVLLAIAPVSTAFR